jgi:hypothetical protein
MPDRPGGAAVLVAERAGQGFPELGKNFEEAQGGGCRLQPIADGLELGHVHLLSEATWTPGRQGGTRSVRGLVADPTLRERFGMRGTRPEAFFVSPPVGMIHFAPTTTNA